MGTDNTLEQINKACLKFLVPLSLEEAYTMIVHEALKLVGGDEGMIVRDIQGDLVTVYGSTPVAASYKVRPRGNTYKAITQHKALVMHHEDIKKLDPKKLTTIRSVIFVPLSYKDISEGVLILRSTKDQHFSQKEKSILELFGSFASLAIKKNELYDESRQALEVRDKFISLASHELRTPLTSINGYIQLLHSRMGKSDTSEAKWVRELYDESKRMTNLIQELLEVNRIKQGQFQFILRESHFAEIVAEAINRCHSVSPEREIVLENELKATEDVVIGDTDKLLQVVIALMENAIKFSPQDSLITASLVVKNQQLCLSISDKGSGIAREDMAKIFDGFYKVSENNEEGMGVGLLLAKHIISYHKGSIDVHSEVKKGTTVEVRLPQQKL